MRSGTTSIWVRSLAACLTWAAVAITSAPSSALVLGHPQPLAVHATGPKTRIGGISTRAAARYRLLEPASQRLHCGICLSERETASGILNWLSEDPLLPMGRIADPMGVNSFLYGRGGPLRWTDPSGLREQTEDEQIEFADINSWVEGSRPDDGLLSQAWDFLSGKQAKREYLQDYERAKSAAIENAGEGEAVYGVVPGFTTVEGGGLHTESITANGREREVAVHAEFLTESQYKHRQGLEEQVSNSAMANIARVQAIVELGGVTAAGIKKAIGPTRVEKSPPSGEFSLLSDTVKFLAEQGVEDPIDRRAIIEAGLQQRVGPETPISLNQFQRLITRELKRGRELEGLRHRLGNLESRVATINKARELEEQGITPHFEYPINGNKNFVDLVGTDSQGKIVRAIQFVKYESPGVINPREAAPAVAIEKALGIKVEMVVTGMNSSSPP